MIGELLDRALSQKKKEKKKRASLTFIGHESR